MSVPSPRCPPSTGPGEIFDETGELPTTGILGGSSHRTSSPGNPCDGHSSRSGTAGLGAKPCRGRLVPLDNGLMRLAQPIDRLPLDQQIDVLHGILSESPLFLEVLQRARRLGWPGWYLAAGCVAQTVWNVLGSRPPEEGIRDYDLPYFEPSDLSWEAEDTAIQAAEQTFVGLPVAVEVRNEARVHLWYEGHFGVPCPPYPSTEAAIDTFPSTASCVGIRLEEDDHWRVYAPYGLSDLLSLVVRPNLTLAPRHVYDEKVSRWRRQWPSLRILPWPEVSTTLSDELAQASTPVGDPTPQE